MHISNNNFGYYVEAARRITWQIIRFFPYFKENIVNRKIIVKIAGDAVVIGREIKVMNLVFTLPDDKRFCVGADGTFLIGNFEIQKENHETYVLTMSEVFQIIDQLDGQDIRIDEDDVYKADVYLTGDMMFLDTLLGISAPNSKHPCLWCKCPKNKFDDFIKWKKDFKSNHLRSY